MSGPPIFAGGYVMLPIQPEGYVESKYFSAQTNEVVIKFAWPGSPALKQHIFHQLGAAISLSTLNGDVQLVQVVLAYKHLGAKFGSDSSQLPEIKARFASAKSASQSAFIAAQTSASF